MKITGLEYHVKASVVLTREDLDLLMLHSKVHYDATCKSLEKVGGFLYGAWMAMEGAESTVPYAWGDRELQLCLKILEVPLPSMREKAGELYFKLLGILERVHQETQKLNDLPFDPGQ